MSSLSVNQENPSDIGSPKRQSNEQPSSFIRRVYSRSPWSDTLELVACAFLTLLMNIIGCELARAGEQHLKTFSHDILPHRYRVVFWFLTFAVGCLITVAAIGISIFGLLFLVKHIYVNCVNFCYVKDRGSYKWWQRKITVQCVVIGVMILTWLVVCLELLNFLFANERFIVYGVFGLVIAVLTPYVSLAFFIEGRRS